MPIKEYECLKIFQGTDLTKVEEEYNTWYKELSDSQLSSSICKRLEVKDRKVAIHHTRASVYVLITVFYVSYVEEEVKHEKDRGKHLDTSGVSAF